MTYRPVNARLQKKPDEICEPFATLRRLIDMRVRDSVTHAYRATFGEYASKLETLQRLLESNGPDKTGLEAARRDAEAARQAYRSARDLLASELGVKSATRAAAASRVA